MYFNEADINASHAYFTEIGSTLKLALKYTELCFTAVDVNVTIQMVHEGQTVSDIDLYYSTDRLTWNNYTLSSIITLTSIGDKVYFRGNNPSGFSLDDGNNYKKFVISGKVKASGNIMSLLHPTDFNNLSTVPDGAFFGLFEDSPIVTAPVLPALTVGMDSYGWMFHNCINLVETPELPATSLGDYAYAEMFQDCTSLKKCAPLYVTELNEGTYVEMFKGCTSIINAPVIKAKIISDYAMYRMFRGCTALYNIDLSTVINVGEFGEAEMFQDCRSLETAPDLSNVTVLNSSSMKNMFNGCIHLKTANKLPNVTEVPDQAYLNMFTNCTLLVNVPSVLPATKIGAGAYKEMYYGCTSLIKTPELKVSAFDTTNGAKLHCNAMFMNCTNLKYA